jgi:cobalt-zinc-cadmium efflux system outer membrane protein
MMFDIRGRAKARLAGMAHPLALMLALAGPVGFATAQPLANPEVAVPRTAPAYGALFRQAQATAPRLAESQANIRVAEGQALQAGFRPNPSAGLEFENLGATSNATGFDALQVTLSVAQPIELGGKRSARVAAGQASIDAATARNRQVVFDYGYELAIAYATAEAAQARVGFLTEAVAAAEEDLRAARALVDAGREADLRAVQAEAASTTARADLESARAEAQTAFATLSGLSGVPDPYTGVVDSLLPLADNLPPPPNEPPIASPAVAAAEAERQAVERRIAVERTRAIPNVTPSVGVRRLTGIDETVLVAGVSIAIPLFDKNQGNIAAATAELDAANSRLNAARLDALNGWRSAVALARAADARVAASSQAEMASNEAYRLVRVGYEAGRTPLVEVLLARRNVTLAQSATLDARVARVRAEAQLARLSARIPFGAAP